MDYQKHWSGIYQTKAVDDVSWYQRRPDLSLDGSFRGNSYSEEFWTYQFFLARSGATNSFIPVPELLSLAARSLEAIPVWQCAQTDVRDLLVYPDPLARQFATALLNNAAHRGLLGAYRPVQQYVLEFAHAVICVVGSPSLELEARTLGLLARINAAH